MKEIMIIHIVIVALQACHLQYVDLLLVIENKKLIKTIQTYCSLPHIRTSQNSYVKIESWEETELPQVLKWQIIYVIYV